MNFIFEKLKLEGLILIKPKIFEDERGFFMESYKKSEFIQNGIDVDFVQDNYSKSQYGVLRGLHFQKPPFEQAKLVRCIEGKIFDVAVDLRKNSKTFKKYLKIELSQENKHMLYIPQGFAHGFVVVSKSAQILYKTNNEYNKESERGIIYNDKELNIDWGINFEPILSKKDINLPQLNKILGEL